MSGIVTTELLDLRYIPLVQATLWDLNPKRHDIQAIAESIKRYGFLDPPRFDETLNAIVEGNGRVQAVALLSAADNATPPDGIALDKETGEWHIPVIFGVDASSRSAAEAYAIDHNNLTMAGFSAREMGEVWEMDDYLEVLDSLEDKPVTVSSFDMALLLEGAVDDEIMSGWGGSSSSSSGGSSGGGGGSSESGGVGANIIVIYCDDEKHQIDTIDALVQLGVSCTARRTRVRDGDSNDH